MSIYKWIKKNKYEKKKKISISFTIRNWATIYNVTVFEFNINASTAFSTFSKVYIECWLYPSYNPWSTYLVL